MTNLTTALPNPQEKKKIIMNTLMQILAINQQEQDDELPVCQKH